jgi:myo-inositol-1(or 4)-monophosphatase
MKKDLMLNLARQISNVVVKEIKKSKHLGDYVGSVGVGGDETKNGDQLVENILKKKLPLFLKKFGIKNCWFVSEETGQMIIGEVNSKVEGIFIIIDPIDGSNNMRPHFTPKPFLGFSIAIGNLKNIFCKMSLDAVEVGLIKDIFHDLEYTAIRNSGSFLNNLKLNSSQLNNLETAILGTSLDRGGQKLKDIFKRGIYKLLLATHCQRRIGSTTLDLCQVATGDYDIYVSMSGGVKVHDIAAAKLIIEEAGGIVELYNNKNINVGKNKILNKLFIVGNEGINNLTFRIITAGNKKLLKLTKKILNLN